MIANCFEAVETHKMSALPTAANVRITENGQVMQPGEGFFNSGGAVHLERDLIDTGRCGNGLRSASWSAPRMERRCRIVEFGCMLRV
jgi:hypothetical protein